MHNTRSNPIELGIKSKSLVDTSYFAPDLCPGHLMAQTCIMRYTTPLSSDDYYIIMHPFSNSFKKVISDIDITRLDKDKELALKQGKMSGKQSIKLGNLEYATKIIDSEEIMMVHNLESLSHQKLKNNLIIKIVKYGYDQVNYVGLFNESTAENPCFNRTGNGGLNCACEDECKPCYRLENEEKTVHYIPLNYENINTNSNNKVKALTSKHCSDPFYTAYSFESVPMSKYKKKKFF